LLPQVLWLAHKFCEYSQTRGSELAREGCVSGKEEMLDVPASSQASLLPQIQCMSSNLWLSHIRGSELAREGCVSGKEEMLDVPAPSQASLLPQILWLVRRLCEYPQPSGFWVGPQVL